MLRHDKTKTLDNFFDDFWALPARAKVAGANYGATVGTMDVSEDQKNIYIEVDVPNYDIDDIKIEVQNKKMTISGNFEAEKSERKYRIKERNFNNFTRTILFETNIDEEDVVAGLENGVLKIVITKNNTETAKKKIEIKKI